ncbi:MAG: UDP-3-O-(3-hydroxymyristoyl)glucosamine N-acyltransferase [Prevotellaceae bacterium]|jgi:UDP-3-O-[3-hydroxymyristoyl] glucosamine N-acyltransferase|nr:UDP-3-O-(3-hydroxymyristoyl)glucosamine N-acyltransferase [Prevotellaceae bacterium]
MILSAQTIAGHLGGTVEGNPDAEVSSAARIEYGKPGTLCFLANPKYEKFLYTTRASIILINKGFELKQPVEATLVRVDNAYQAIAAMLDLLNTVKMQNKRGHSWRSKISWKAKLGKNVYVGAFAYIAKGAKIGNNVKIYPQVYIGENVCIGDNTVLYAGAKVYAGCKIGADCIVHSGAVIGADGFGFAPQNDGSYKKIAQTGIVVIEDNVEIGSNTSVDRATMEATIIHSGVKIDNLVQIAHNVEIGENTVIAAQAGIAGSAKTGKRCVVGGQVGIVGHINIADGTQIGAQSGVSKNTVENAAIAGSPAIDYAKNQRNIAAYRTLPQMRDEIQTLKKEIEKLRKKLTE